VRARKNGGIYEIPAIELFADFPVALLIAAAD
jgi:hypothetical protein